MMMRRQLARVSPRAGNRVRVRFRVWVRVRVRIRVWARARVRGRARVRVRLRLLVGDAHVAAREAEVDEGRISRGRDHHVLELGVEGRGTG